MADYTEVDLGVDALPQHLLNKQNRDLTAQIAFYEQENERVVREADEHKERLKFMIDHLANVKGEIVNTQSLFEAKRKEISTEDHLAQLAERERGRLLQDIASSERRRSEVQEALDAVQNRIFKGNLRMDELKAGMNFNQEELEQWDLARKQKEDDQVVLRKYTKDDEAKVKDLGLRIENLSQQTQARRHELEDEITETRGAQIELDKTAEDYKALHRERQYLLDQWEQAVRAMHGRDAAIKAAGDHYGEGKAWVLKRTKQLKARREFHDVELGNNRELDAKIAQEERVLAKYREDHAVLSKHLGDLSDEVEVVRNTLSKAVHDKGALTAQKGSLAATLAEKQEAHQRMQLQHEKIVARLQDELAAATDMERQGRLVQDLFAQTEQSMKALDREMSRIKDEQYQASQQLYGVRRQQSTFLAEISGAQAQGRNMAAKVSQLDAESFKQQELLYSIEFNIQQMERRVNRAKGERTEEEKRELQEKIDMLQRMLDDLLKQHKVLDTQVKRVTDDLRQSKYDAVQLEKEKQRVGDELLELTLENESCNVELQRMVKLKQDALVHADVLKLQAARIKKMLQRRGQEVLGLENRQEQLALTVVEREVEIKVHHDVLRMEAKAVEEERRVVASELLERRRQVGHLTARYQVLVGRMQGGEGETTHAQLIVRAAKEREELQAQGDALDADIKRCQKESRKLDRLIATLKGSNAKYKHQFTKVAEGDEELVQQKLLMTKSKELQTVINRRTTDMKDFLKTEMSQMSELQDRQRSKEELAERLRSLVDGADTIARETEEQKELVARYDVAIGKLRRTTEEEIVSDVLLAEERDKTDSTVALLCQAAELRGGAELQRVFESALARSGIEVPASVSMAGGGADNDE